MLLCFPISVNCGLESQVCSNFSLAAAFIIADPESASFVALDNDGELLRFGTCDEIEGLAGHRLDAVITGGIGDATLQKLSRVGIRVYLARGETVLDNLTCYREGTLTALTPLPHHHHD